ncbi:hypothetical protein BH20ACT4_BH20ACT4_11760 [soil metagenome]
MSVRPSRRRRLVARVAFVGFLGVSAACSDGTAKGLSVEGVWARATAESATTGAVYLTIESGDADRLVGVSVPATVAASASIHRTVEEDAVVSMERVAALDIPAAEPVALAPGGTHVMLVDLASPLQRGDQFALTLDFESQPQQMVVVEVSETAPGE